MSVLAATVVILSLTTVLHLLVTLGMARRLREQERSPGHRSPQTPPPPSDGSQALLGRPVDHIDTRAVTGRQVTGPIAENTLLGIFSARCAPCREQAVAFAEVEDPRRVAVVSQIGGTPAEQAGVVELLGDTPVIIAGPEGTALALQWGINRFPTIARTDSEGVVDHVSDNVTSCR